MAGVGLIAADPVVWLLTEELDVKRAVGAFVHGHADRDYVDVAGPPDDDVILKLHAQGNDGGVPLPTVRLRMKLVDHHLSGQRAVHVGCSDADLMTIADWRRRDAIKRALAKKAS